MIIITQLNKIYKSDKQKCAQDKEIVGDNDESTKKMRHDNCNYQEWK